MHLDPEMIVLLIAASVLCGAACGVILYARWSARRRGRMPGTVRVSPDDEPTAVMAESDHPRSRDAENRGRYMLEFDEPHVYSQELWDRIVGTLLRDARVQAVAGRDRSLYSTLREPLFITEENEDSPLLPGEVAYSEVPHLGEYLQRWRDLFPALDRMTAQLDPSDLVLYRAVADESLFDVQLMSDRIRQALTEAGFSPDTYGPSDLPEELLVYRLIVRTPGRQHEFLFQGTADRIAAFFPGPPGWAEPLPTASETPATPFTLGSGEEKTPAMDGSGSVFDIPAATDSRPDPPPVS